MPRFRSSVLTASVLSLSIPLAPAQNLPPPNPIDLVRGLRESGQADLALEYLTDVAAKASPDVVTVLPLERAKCQLELANLETDDSVRAGMVAEAKAGFDTFLKASANHPRAPEAAVALARLLTLEGKAKLQQAKKLTDAEARKKAAAAARPLFDDAAKRYAAAAAGLKKLSEADFLSPARQAELTRDYFQAVLDRGINLYNLSDAYVDARGPDADAKVKAGNDAAKVFEDLSRADPNQLHPLTWVARAWSGEVQLLIGEPLKADNIFRDLLVEARRQSAPPGAAAGVKMARFFQLREQYVKQQNDPLGRMAVRDACLNWLRDYPSAKPTAEIYAVNYYLGSVLLNEGLKRENLIIERSKPAKPGDPIEEKVTGVKADGVKFIRDADAAFRKIVRTDNEYTDRATRQRAKAIPYLVSSPDRPVEKFTTFDECYMVALTQLDKLRDTKDDERTAVANRVVALLERAMQLPIPPEATRDAVTAQLSLAQAYIAANRPRDGATLAEKVARTARNPAIITRGGLIALYGYQQASTAAENAAGNDRDKMIALCEYLEKAAPNDPGVDDVRFQYGVLMSQASRANDMFEAFSRVPARSSRYALAKLYEGVAAYDLLRPRAANEPAPEMTTEAKAAIFRRAVADLSAVPAPPKSAKPEEAANFIKLQLQLAQLHMTAGVSGYPIAEKVAVATIKTAEAVPDLPSEQKQVFAMRGDILRLKAVYGQVWPLYQAGKFTETADKFAPLLAEVVKAGPAVKTGQEGEVADVAKLLDADRLRFVLVPTLNARIREGAVEKTGELLDQLRKFGGDLNTTARIVQQGIATVKPTVDALRKEGKDAEAAKLVSAVTGMVNKLAGEKDLPVEVRFNLGRSFKDLGEYAKAVELLAQIPPPSDAAFLPGDPKVAPPENEPAEVRKKRETAFEANKSAAAMYRLAQLELHRCFRLNREYDKCDALLDEVLGKDRKSGWGAKFPDFRRESYYLAEAKAALAMTPKEAVPLWNAAMGGWRGWAGEYKAAIDGLKAKADDPEEKVNEVKRKREALKPVWFDLMTELYRCTVEAQASVNKSDAAKLTAALAKQGGFIFDFEKNNTPLPNGIKLKLHLLLETYPELKQGYTTAGGKELLTTPVIDP